MSELQATLEIQVELSKFYNVDLFQRGYYQIRTSLRTPPKSPIKVEVSLPRNSDCPLVFPASVINGVAVSKTYQILYRNEDVAINDVILFRVHMLVDAQKIEESIDTANIEVQLELWFTDEEFGPEQQEKLQCISQRIVKLHMTAAKGLHQHLPILFDYFHLATVCVTIHGTLLALHQPYMNLNKPPKTGWVRGPESTLESVLFGGRPASVPQPSVSTIFGSNQWHAGWMPETPSFEPTVVGSGPRYSVSPRLQQATQIYRAICSVLLSAYESLQSSYEILNAKLPPYQQIKIEHHDCHRKLEMMCSVIQNLTNEEDLLQMATSDVSQLCAENVILWTQYQEMVTLNDKAVHHLAREHHTMRVKRFAEAFFTFEFPKQAMVACYEPSIHGHADLAAMVKTSPYFLGLIPLAAECWDMDGDHTTLPIVFEDVYCEPKAKQIRTTSDASFASKASSDQSESGDGQKNSKQSSDTSSVHSGDSPKLRRSKLKLIKNLKPDIIKRPSSFIVNDPSTNTGGNVAGINVKKPDCTLVGYRKIQQTTAVPLYELGTLIGPQDHIESSPSKSPLYNAASMPTLLARGHVSMIQSGSMPELSANPVTGRYSTPPDFVTAVRAGIGGSGLVGFGLQHPDITSSTVSGSQDPGAGHVESVPVPNGADPVPTRDRRSSSTTPSDCSTSANINVENGYVSSNSDSNDKSSPELEGLKRGQLTGDHVADFDLGVDYNLLADTLTKALGEPETTVDAQASIDRDTTEGGQTQGSSGSSSSRNSTKVEGSTADSVSKGEGGDSGQGDSFSDAPLSDSTKDRLGSLTSGEFHIDSSMVESILSNSSCQGTSNKDSDSESLMSNEYTIFELLKEEMKKQEASLSPAGTSEPADPNSHSQTATVNSSNTDVAGDPSSSSCDCVSSSSRAVPPGDLLPASTGTSRPVVSQPRPGVVNAMVSSASTPELSALVDRDKEQKLVSPVGDHTINFITAKETLRRQLKYNGHIYSDFPTQASVVPYFWPQDMPRGTDSEGIHLIVCVHGLDGNSADLRLVRTYLEMAMPGGRHDFLMSERNQPDTFADFEVMTDRLVAEVLYHIEMYGLNPSRVSFIGHSLGNLIIRSALSRPEMAPVLPKLYTFLSLSGPHLGTLYNSSGLVNMGMWFMQKWKKSGSLLQLSLKDHVDPRQSFIYKLSQKPGLDFFQNILLVGSVQDRYVPFHSSRIELCKSALKDTSGLGAVYAEMVSNILQPIAYKSDLNFIRYDVFHALPNTANSLIGRAAHIAVLDSELFIEKFMTVAALKYFK